MLGRSILRGYSTSAGSNAVVSSTLLLSRTPVITADLPKFESQYHRYQNELWKRLMWTFPKWFYFRGGTLSEQRFRQLNKNPVANNPDIEFPRGRPEIRHQRDRRFKQELRLPKTYKEADEIEVGSEVETKHDNLARKIVPNSRTTKADETNDLSSLERRLSRTLYLVIQDGGEWVLPNFAQGADVKPLHTLAEEGLYKLGGTGINYFNVSNTPCHLHVSGSNKAYFIKSHILSGLFEPQPSGLKHLWLSKDELKERLPKEYYIEIEHLLSDV